MSRLEKTLMAEIARASKDFNLIEPNDRIMVGISGGKDSYTLLHLLRQIQKRVGFPFSIVAVNLDQGHPGFPGHVIRGYLEAEGYEYRMIQRDTYSIVQEKVPAGKTTCSLCSRLRRGILYDVAVELKATKIALGHHRDDIIETAMLNLLYSGQLKAMPPKLRSDDGRNTVIRPLAYCAEEEIAAFAEEMKFPIIPCDLCGSQENLQRKQVKRLIGDLHAVNKNVKGNMLNALRNVRPTHLLDPKLRELYGVDRIEGSDEALLAIEGGGSDDDAMGGGCASHEITAAPAPVPLKVLGA
ncbi:tRNA 2-thiocytidine(32) synthetase TtcA [Vulgatibacter sp.]|uniref:tRNA 2-thiocytidine(32) synthetase TtcA n=1 Tax=Vulgatibacter sp. TaxID=1971226 RepID=UPI0035658F4F